MLTLLNWFSFVENRSEPKPGNGYITQLVVGARARARVLVIVVDSIERDFMIQL